MILEIKKIKVTRNTTNKKLKFKEYNRSFSTYSRVLSETKKVENRTIIKPLAKSGTMKYFSTVDIETINYNGKQIPLLIGLGYPETVARFHVETFIIDKNLLIKDQDAAIKELWNRFFNYLSKNKINKYFETIFAHNLGAFDGYFIYKGLLSFTNKNVETIIDQHNKFILIKYGDFVFKDSYRIFPVSLNELCKVFNIPGKSHEYKDIYNNINILKNNKD